MRLKKYCEKRIIIGISHSYYVPSVPTKTMMSLNEVSIGEMELKKEGLRKEQTKFEMEDMDELDGWW